MPMCTTSLYHFDPVTDSDTEFFLISSCMNKTTWSSDPFSRLLMSHLRAGPNYCGGLCETDCVGLNLGRNKDNN